MVMGFSSGSSPSLKSWFCGGRKTRGPGEQICVARKKTNNKLNPHVTSGLENKPGPQCWESSTLTTAPSRLLQKEIYDQVMSYKKV